MIDFAGDSIKPKQQFSMGCFERNYAAASFSASHACVNNKVVISNFSKYADSCMWYFGDGRTSKMRNPAIAYSAAGAYTIKLIVYGKYGDVDSTHRTVQIFAYPKADFGYQYTCLRDSTKFSNFSQNQSQSIWKIDNKIATKNSDSVFLYQFQQIGNYKIKLIAQLFSYCADSIEKKIEIHSSVNALFKISNVCSGDSHTIVNLSENDSMNIWKIKNDSFLNNNDSFKYKFEPNKTNIVHLISTSKNLCSSLYVNSATFFPVPKAEFSANNTCIDDTVRIINKSTPNCQYTWKINGKRAQVIDNLNTYLYKPTVVNENKIELTVTDSNQCKSQFNKTIYIYPLPVSHIQIKLFKPKFIFSFSDSQLYNSQWFVNNLLLDTNKIFNYLPKDTNSFDVQLKITDKNGCSNFIIKKNLNPNSLDLIYFKNSNERVIIYPNPALGQFSVLGSSLQSIRIYAVDGKMIYYKNALQQKQVLVKTESLSKGVFWIVVDTSFGKKVEKLIVN